MASIAVSAVSAVSAASVVRQGRPSQARIYLLEIRYEFLKLLRARTYSLSVIGFPVMFYTLFGLSNKHVVVHGIPLAKLLLGGYCSFGVVGAALFGIGVGLAGEKAAGWLELKRASPMPPTAYLVAKLVTAAAFGVLIVGILCGLAVMFGGVSLSAAELGRLLVVTLGGSLPFAAMGLLLAQVIPTAAAAGIINLIYLPMSFASGLWMPIDELPKWLQKLAPVFPTYHLAQLMLRVFGGNNPAQSTASHWWSLLGFTVVMLAAAAAVFSRAEQRA